MTQRKTPIRRMQNGSFLILLLSTRYLLGEVAASVGNFEIDANGNVKQSADEIIHVAEDEASQSAKQEDHHNQHSDDKEVEDSRDQTNPNTDPEEDDECGLYIAPSTIEGAGLGIFTAHRRSVGDTVGFGEVVIPMVEVPFYNGNKKDLFNPLIHYYWKGSEKGLHGIVADHRTSEVNGFVPGLDAAVNCNLALLNVDNSGAEYDNSNLNRNRDPMAGSMTSYHTTSSPIIRDIPAGGELFKFYGDNWFVAREERFGLIPLSEDYDRAQKILNSFEKLSKDHFAANAQLKEELWELARYEIGGILWSSRIMNALPYMVEDVEKAAESEIASLHQPQAIRSNEYLKQHGKCMDNVRPGPSTLESAGRGGFATRNLSKGIIITGTPLHHIPNKELVTIYRMELNVIDSKDGDETWVRHTDDVVGYQVMLNYCFGHEESALLLCPYGSVSYINHNQSLANVKIQWSQDGITAHNQSWVESKSLEDMEGEYKIGLAFDFVATKDIQKGEELFLDYGDSFEEELNNHMARWQPPQNDFANYTPAEIFDKEVFDSPLRTEEEQKLEPYPENMEIRCHSGLVLGYMKTGDWDGFSAWETREAGYPCRILRRYPNAAETKQSEHNNFLYKVELKLPLHEVGRQFIKDAFNYFVKKDVSRGAIKFFNKPYTTDLFLPNMFRKDIGIPNDMFPDHWKNGARPRRQDLNREDGPAAPYRLSGGGN